MPYTLYKCHIVPLLLINLMPGLGAKLLSNLSPVNRFWIMKCTPSELCPWICRTSPSVMYHPHKLLRTKTIADVSGAN